MKTTIPEKAWEDIFFFLLFPLSYLLSISPFMPPCICIAKWVVVSSKPAAEQRGVTVVRGGVTIERNGR